MDGMCDQCLPVGPNPEERELRRPNSMPLWVRSFDSLPIAPNEFFFPGLHVLAGPFANVALLLPENRY